MTAWISLFVPIPEARVPLRSSWIASSLALLAMTERGALLAMTDEDQILPCPPCEKLFLDLPLPTEKITS
jgi:hypothetical protein